MTAGALGATVERFNGRRQPASTRTSAAGDDEYDTFFAGGEGPNKALDARSIGRPTIAARFVLSDLGTKGGLVTDAAGRVLREDGSASRGSTRPATRRPRCSARSTPARARRSARRWSSRSLAVRDSANPTINRESALPQPQYPVESACPQSAI